MHRGVKHQNIRNLDQFATDESHIEFSERKEPLVDILLGGQRSNYKHESPQLTELVHEADRLCCESAPLVGDVLGFRRVSFLCDRDVEAGSRFLVHI